MILLIGATALSLTALQASINVPRDAMRECLKSATTTARSQNVAADAVEAYMRNSCSVQIGSLRSALQSFNMKNGMAKKAAAADADLTVDDYVASPVEHYRFNYGSSTATATATATPAQAAGTPPKP